MSAATLTGERRGAAGEPVSAPDEDRRGAPRWPRILLRSLVDLVLVVWLAATIAFLALRLIPGDPLDVLLSGVQDATPEMRAEIAAHYGLDRPAIVQYFGYLWGVVQGDLGTSYHRGSPVTQVLFSELGPTVELTVAAMLVAVVAAVALALATSGQRPGVRLAAQGLEVVAVSVPSFWLGIVLMTVFSFGLRWVPAFSGDSPAGLILPVVTLAVPLVGVITQLLRERVEHQLHEPFVTTVRARGVSEARLRSQHLLRHASVPVLTLSSIIFGSLLTGTVVIETLFARPGIGRVIVLALQDRDVPVVLGFVVFAAVVFIVINTVVDLLLPLIDPRLKGA
ncbi:peptide/nickel transport system permease protein [Mycolicibacterium mucogenicum 261Sha1.1M5]|uniref:ABC transporter permease n=1 Tax=Leucobacter aridicollis TaxID=283878 RepID=UPI000EB00011|nr:ABC transporter permease [Leucobacter aridicollis]MCS3426455.1 peptide/nickel transport system permease protein [Leucobacter aridicollis]RKQ89398.1 peptide/nickel transport system permease protein [Mycolicibacterium mucogenicum 261Sha1.1M5]